MRSASHQRMAPDPARGRGERGSFTDETFSADAAVVTFHGISEHPGYAKGKLVNALKVAGAFLDLLPREEFSPETSDNREGFVHPVYIEGIAEKSQSGIHRSGF